MIIAVDFDGTLQIGTKTNLQLYEMLKVNQRQGNAVLLNIC